MEFKTNSMTLMVHPNRMVEAFFSEEAVGNATVEDAKENMALLHEVMVGKNRVLLIHVPGLYTNKKVIQYYADNDPDAHASAMLVKSFGAKVIGNLILTIIKAFGPRKHPIKLFTDQSKAETWLLAELERMTGT